jgi:GxxExxY protein
MMSYESTERRRLIPEYANLVSQVVVDSALTVHRTLGPGLLESVYEACLAYELTKRGYACERQVVVAIEYDGVKLDDGLRLDLLVEKCVVVELKAVETLLPLHDAQLLTYLKLTGHRLGLLINFNVPLLKDGIRRRVL